MGAAHCEVDIYAVMSTRPRRPRNLTKTTFPRPSPLSHESPTHRTAAATSFSPFPLRLTTYLHYSTLPRLFYAVTFAARSPVRQCANICHVVIFRRPYPSPHRLCCMFSICFTFYFAFEPCCMFPIRFHFTYKLLHTK